MEKILITDQAHPLLMEGLEKLNYLVDYIPNISPPDVNQIIDRYSGLIINSKINANKELLQNASRLHFIARLGSGLDVVDLPYAAEKGIFVVNSPEGNKNAVAEHTIGMLLSLVNHLCQADSVVRSFNWIREEYRGTELMGKTIGIIGFGNTGSCLAEKLSNWKLKILVFDKYRKDISDSFPFVEAVSLTELQKKSDIISFHVPLNEETRDYFNKGFEKKCKNGMILINTSRGKVVNIIDLLGGLSSGKISGACLDVLENEKPESYTEEEETIYRRLFNMDQVVLSPHIAGWTKESFKRIAEVLLEKIEIIRSQPLKK